MVTVKLYNNRLLKVKVKKLLFLTAGSFLLRKVVLAGLESIDKITSKVAPRAEVFSTHIYLL